MADETFDWTLADAMTEEEIHAAALSDPDAQPMTEERLKKMRLVPRVKSLRRALRLSCEEFSARYRIPVETLRAWEERRAEPTSAERAYLKVIAHAPDMVRQALEPRVIAPA
jgi:putative transcriptional regulator